MTTEKRREEVKENMRREGGMGGGVGLEARGGQVVRLEPVVTGWFV